MKERKFSRREVLKGLGAGTAFVLGEHALGRNIPEVQAEEVLYEKDFSHLRHEDGEWEFGKVFEEKEDSVAAYFTLTGVILDEPEKRPLDILDENNKVIHTYQCWFAKIGYPDFTAGDERLITNELLVDVENVGVQVGSKILLDDFVSKKEVEEKINFEVTDRGEEFRSLIQFGKPVIVGVIPFLQEGAMEKALELTGASSEPFPGKSESGKRIYFLGSVLEPNNCIGRPNLQSSPTLEEIKKWKEKEALPSTNFLGLLNALIITRAPIKFPFTVYCPAVFKRA